MGEGLGMRELGLAVVGGVSGVEGGSPAAVLSGQVSLGCLIGILLVRVRVSVSVLRHLSECLRFRG